MGNPKKAFISDYAAAFDDYLVNGQESALGRAYDLGRKALAIDSGLFVITAAHHEALHKSLEQAADAEREQVLEKATTFLSECLSPFEMAQRGFQDSIAALNSLNKTLHKQEKDLHLLLSPMPNLLLTVDTHDCLAALFVPSGFPSILRTQQVGSALVEVLPGEIASQVMVALFSVRQSNRVLRLECPLNVRGQTRYFDLQLSPVDGSRDVLLVIDDMTGRKEMQLAEHRQRILAEGLRDTAIALNSSLDLDDVLNRIVLSIGRVVPHDTANIMLIEDQNARVVRSFGYAENGLEAYETLITEVLISSYNTPALYRVIASKERVIVFDLEDKTEDREYFGMGLRGSAVSAPIMVGDSIIGVINLNSFTPGFFTPLHADNLQIFANQAAVAIENARLFEQAQESAALNERQRLARDLHDSVSQSLFSASVITESLPNMFKRDPNKAASLLLDLHRVIKGTLAEMRLLLLELRPANLVTTSLDKLLEQLITAVQGQTNLTLNLKTEGEEQLPEEAHIAFYRIAQEAMNNIVKHSRATQVNLELRCLGEKTTLHIRDNGQGFDPEQKTAGLGLNNMQERADMIGALIEVQSQSGQGTQIMVSWAMKRDQRN